MELIIHIVAILSVVQSTRSAPSTSVAPPLGSQTPSHITTSTTQATEIRTKSQGVSPTQRTFDGVNYSTVSTPSLLLGTTEAHSEQNSTKTDSQDAVRTHLPTTPSASSSVISTFVQDEVRTTIERTSPGPKSSTHGNVTPVVQDVSLTTKATPSVGITLSPSAVPSTDVLHTTPKEVSEGPKVNPSQTTPHQVRQTTTDQVTQATPSVVKHSTPSAVLQTNTTALPQITSKAVLVTNPEGSLNATQEGVTQATQEQLSVATPTISPRITAEEIPETSPTAVPQTTRPDVTKTTPQEVSQTTQEEPSGTPIPGEPGLRSSPRVVSEYIFTSIRGITEIDALSSRSKSTLGFDIATDSATPGAVLLTTFGDLETLPGTDLADTHPPVTTQRELSKSTVGPIPTTNALELFTTPGQPGTIEPTGADSFVTELQEIPTDLLTTHIPHTSSPVYHSTDLPVNTQVPEVSTILEGITDVAPSARDLISTEGTTPLTTEVFDATEVVTLPTTTDPPVEAGSVGTTFEVATDFVGTEANPATELQEIITELITDEEVEGTSPIELWTIETSSEEVTGFEITESLSSEGYDSTDPITTIETEVIPAPCLCDVETAQLSARVCLCNSSLALSNYTYHAHLVRRNHNNTTPPETTPPDTQVHSALIGSGSGCWNISVPLGGSYRLVVTAEDGMGNLASTPTAYFYSGLMPPSLSVQKVPGAIPSLELYWQFPYPTYVDDVTIYVRRDGAAPVQLTWIRVDDVRTTGRFTFVTSGMGSMYSVAVVIASGGDRVTSNYDTVVIAPPHPQHVRVAQITPDLLTVEWPHDTTSCRGSCSYLVRYQQTAPYRYNAYPVVELPVTCPNLLPAQPARSTSPNALNGCSAYLRHLIPGALYNIDVYASSYNVLSETAAQLRQRTLPAPPQNVTVTNVTEYSISINWTPGVGYRTRYRLHAFAPSYSEEVGEVRGDVTFFTFHNLLAGTRYIITIRATANSTDGEMVLVGDTTLPTRPGPVDRLRLEPQSDDRQVRLAFLAPMWPNGVLEGYQVEYIGKRDGNRTCSTGQQYLPVMETSVIIDDLKGGCNYTFTVKARNEVGLGPGVSDTIITAIGVPAVPESRPPPPPSKAIKSTNFVVNFDPSMFDDVNGEITHVIVIVAESSATNEPGHGNSSLPRMRTWAEAISNDVIPPYQTSEPIALSDLFQDTRGRRSVADTTRTTPTKISVGTEECSYDDTTVYCNGPLIQGRSYVYRFRGISPGGYADTKNSLPVSLPMSPHGVIIGISTALFSLLVIVIILSIVVIVRKFRLDGRGRYLPANMKDVELQRVANNSHHTLSKQKYSRPVRVNEFTRDWCNMNADSNYGYSQEYEAIRKVGRKMTTHTAVSPANVGKNRYTNILPYDRTRVKLSPVDDEEGSDYINANYIPGFSSPREYVACQGPLPGTSDDMWRMIWEQNVTTVVMVTQLVEKGKVKCDQYWPDDHMPVLYGDIQVTLNETIEETHWNIKEFAVQLRDQRRYVRHWNFLSWPDHGVPESSLALLGFIKKIRSTKPPSSSPMAVHCSAGVGRTGTFIVLDHVLQHMEQYDFVDVMGVVCGMRMHRNFMVQTEQQYVFIHRCLLDVIEERGLAPVPMMSGSLP